MRNRFIAMAAAAVLSVTMVACSSADDDTADASEAQVVPSAAGDGSADEAPGADADGADDDAAEDAADAADSDSADEAVDTGGGDATCELLKTFYNDVISLPERVDAGITDEEAAAMIDPVVAVKDDLPGMIGVVLPIFQHDFDFASVMSDGEEMQEYLDRGTHDTAMEALISSTQTACGLPASWPGDE